MKNQSKLLWILGFVVVCILILCTPDNQPETISSTEANNVAVLVSVQRTGNILTNIGELEIWIDEEKVFGVDGNSTNSAIIMMPVGTHTIQAKGQGDKSKKLKFVVTEDSENEFYYSAEISNWFGVKFEEKKYIQIN